MNDFKKILDRKFDKILIKWKPGRGGKKLKYVEGAEYIRRLNEAFDCKWSWEIQECFSVNDDLVVRGLLSVEINGEKILKEAYGGATLKKSRGTDQYIDPADDYKAAATDALKKASSLLGIGLHLYSDGENIKSENINNEQTSTIIDIAKKSNMTGIDLANLIRKEFGKKLKELTKKEADYIIKGLKENNNE